MTSPPVPFAATIVHEQGVLTVSVSGEFEGANVESFDAVTGRIDILRPRLVVLDLASVALIDSAAIGAIMRFRQRFHELETDLQIRAPRPFQKRLFEITGLSHVLAD